jgi:hypothetical protein
MATELSGESVRHGDDHLRVHMDGATVPPLNIALLRGTSDISMASVLHNHG